MVGRTPAEAVHHFVEPLQQVLSCVTDTVIHVSRGYYPRSEPHSAELHENPAPIHTRLSTLQLFVAYRYSISEVQARTLWNVQIVSYNFTLLDASTREIFAYHWHPVGVSTVTTPHLHLGPGALIGRDELRTAHLPTGAVALADVVRFAITDFGVIPRRDDWTVVLS